MKLEILSLIIWKFSALNDVIHKFQVKLHYTEKALQLIANKAMTKNTGARGLRAILEGLLTDAMYEVTWLLCISGL